MLLFVTGSGDRTVRLWDVSTQLEVARMVLFGLVKSVAFDTKQKGSQKLRGRVSKICLSLNVSGKYLASGGARGVTCYDDGDADNECD